MEWLTKELLTVSGPMYFFLQVLMLARYRGRWLLLSLAPLLVMVPLAVHAGYARAAGFNGWPLLLVLTTPFACLYLLGLAVLKGALTQRAARERR